MANLMFVGIFFLISTFFAPSQQLGQLFNQGQNPQLNQLQLALNSAGYGNARNDQYGLLNSLTQNNNFGYDTTNSLLGGNNILGGGGNSLLGDIGYPGISSPYVSNQWELEAAERSYRLDLAKLARDMEKQKNELLSIYTKGYYKLMIDYHVKKADLDNERQRKLVEAQVKIRQNELEKRRLLLDIYK